MAVFVRVVAIPKVALVPLVVILIIVKCLLPARSLMLQKMISSIHDNNTLYWKPNECAMNPHYGGCDYGDYGDWYDDKRLQQELQLLLQKRQLIKYPVSFLID